MNTQGLRELAGFFFGFRLVPLSKTTFLQTLNISQFLICKVKIPRSQNFSWFMSSTAGLAVSKPMKFSCRTKTHVPWKHFIKASNFLGSHSLLSLAYHTVKKVIYFPVPSRDVTNQTLPGGKIANLFLQCGVLFSVQSLLLYNSNIWLSVLKGTRRAETSGTARGMTSTPTSTGSPVYFLAAFFLLYLQFLNPKWFDPKFLYCRGCWSCAFFVKKPYLHHLPDATILQHVTNISPVFVIFYSPIMCATASTSFFRFESC